MGVIKPWPTPSHLLPLPKRQELPMGHLSFCKTSRRSLLPAAHCGILIPVLSGSVFRRHHVSARWEKERLSHCPSQAAWQSCALASNSKYQTPLFPGPQENRWVTRRQLQKMFSRLCLSNGLKKERKKKKRLVIHLCLIMSSSCREH